MEKDLKKIIKQMEKLSSVCDKKIKYLYGLKECQYWYDIQDSLNESIHVLKAGIRKYYL